MLEVTEGECAGAAARGRGRGAGQKAGPRGRWEPRAPPARPRRRSTRPRRLCPRALSARGGTWPRAARGRADTRARPPAPGPPLPPGARLSVGAGTRSALSRRARASRGSWARVSPEFSARGLGKCGETRGPSESPAATVIVRRTVGASGRRRRAARGMGRRRPRRDGAAALPAEPPPRVARRGSRISARFLRPWSGEAGRARPEWCRVFPGAPLRVGTFRAQGAPARAKSQTLAFSILWAPEMQKGGVLLSVPAAAGARRYLHADPQLAGGALWAPDRPWRACSSGPGSS